MTEDIDADQFARETFGVDAHSRAKEHHARLEGYWSLLAGDTGFNAAAEFRDWLAEHGKSTLGGWLRDSAAAWDEPTVYDEDLLSKDNILDRIEADPSVSVDFHHAVRVLDVIVIVTAFSQFVVTGHIDLDAKPILRLALRRQLHPLVLDAIFEGDLPARETHRAELQMLLELVDDA